jgi:hypothetical protein
VETVVGRVTPAAQETLVTLETMALLAMVALVALRVIRGHQEMQVIPATTALKVTVATAAVLETRAHLVTLVTPETTVLLEMAALEVMRETPVIQAAPEMLVGMALVDPVVLAELIVRSRVAQVGPAVRAAVQVILELQETQVQVLQQVHQAIPVELVRLARLAILAQEEAVLPVEIRVTRAEQDRLAVRVTQAQQAQEET